ncbi:MAG: glycerate kinase [Terriglobales bacterium]
MSETPQELRGREMREQVRAIFLHALAEIGIDKAFKRNVEYSRGVLRIGQDLLPINSYGRVTVIAIGKAAQAMAQALNTEMGPQAGIIATPTPPEVMLPGFSYFIGGHPMPNAESVKAARSILRILDGRKENDLVIYLLSGGGSAVMEAPLDDETLLEDLIATYRVLVHSGGTIAEINAIRKHLSAVKGGRLARAAFPAQQVSIMISDVPEDALDSLASGPTMPDSSTEADCYRIAETYKMVPQFPPLVREIFESKHLEETPKSDDAAFVRARWWPILSSAAAEKAAAEAASRAGFAVEIDHSCDDWEYAKAADYLLNRLRELRKGVSRACVISGGEVTVSVPPNPGTGGRNQHFALYCAEKIEGENICVLSAGTDGVDGNSPAAGAVVDGTTVARAGAGLASALKRFDGFPLFGKLADAVVTGPTGNNVRDLRVLVAY